MILWEITNESSPISQFGKLKAKKTVAGPKLETGINKGKERQTERDAGIDMDIERQRRGVRNKKNRVRNEESKNDKRVRKKKIGRGDGNDRHG